jgi:hypothetical protein
MWVKEALILFISEALLDLMRERLKGSIAL